jgi:ElaB/YqjD/DUF883 family membrane-anchored ribosome-binding protein
MRDAFFNRSKDMQDTQEKFESKIDDPADKAGAQEVRDNARTLGKAPDRSVVGDIVEAVKEQVQTAAAGASGLAGMAKDTAQEWASSVGSAAVQAKDKARHVASAATDKVGEVGEDLTALIRRHPLEALLAGIGVGFAVGFLAAQVLRRS